MSLIDLVKELQKPEYIQLSNEVVYPVIPKRRVYGLNDKIRLYIMRR